MSDSNNTTGTTPLPTALDNANNANSPIRLWLDVNALPGQAQQPQTQQIANFDAKINEDCINGCTVAVNPHFLVYTVKNGLIRVLHRHSPLRTLLRAHQEQRVTDVQFFPEGDVLATAGHDETTLLSSVVIWRIVERSPEVAAEKLLEMRSSVSQISRILWHSFNPNQFWMVHTNAAGTAMATLVETTRIPTRTVSSGKSSGNATPTNATAAESVAVCEFDFLVMENAVTVQAFTSDLVDLAWSPRDNRHLLTAHASGQVILWDLKQVAPRGDGTVAPAQVGVLQTTQPLSRCLFLPHDNQVGKGNEHLQFLTSCFATASHQNSQITLWSPFVAEAGDDAQKSPQMLQVLALERPAPSYIVNVVSGIAPPDTSPLSSFLVLANRHAGSILAFHLKAQWSDSEPKTTLLAGADYVVPFATRYPVFSWSVQCAPTTDITEEELVDQGGLVFDTKLFSYQSKLVQCLTLTSYMCLPPETSWMDSTPAVRVEGLQTRSSMLETAATAVTTTTTTSAESVPIPTRSEEEELNDQNALELQAEIQYDEDYDYEGENEEEDEDEDEEEEEDEDTKVAAAPAAPPEPSLVDNPFANWLGAIASTDNSTTGVPPPPAAVVPPPKVSPAAASAPPPKSNGANATYAVPIVTAPPASDLPAPDGEPLAFLSPNDFVKHATNPAPQQQQQLPVSPENAAAAKPPEPEKKQESGKKGNKANKKNKNKSQNNSNADTSAGMTPTGPITLLKRDTTPKPATPPPAATTPVVNAASSVDIAGEIRRAVKEEMNNVVVPALKNTLKESLDAAMIKPLQASIDQLSKKGVTVDHSKISASMAASVDSPLRTAFADSMKTVFIPTMESVTGQILEKLSDNLKAQNETNGNGNNNTTTAEIVAMSTQLSTMTELVAELTREVQSLRASHDRQLQQQQEQLAAGQQAAAQKAPPQPAKSVETVKAEIRNLLNEKNFEAAFTKAVSASTAELAVFCCANADLNEVLAMPNIRLSQPIVICLIQQLGTVVATSRASNLTTELEWLQDLALSLDPKDKQIQQHVPRVLQQLVTSINARLVDCDAAVKRPLQRLLTIVRGIALE